MRSSRSSTSGERQRGGRFNVGDFAREARVALRSLKRRPGFAATAIVLIALGVGATSMIFSVVDSVLLRPLPYPDSDRMVVLQKDQSSFPVPDFVDVQASVGSFDRLAAIWNETQDITSGGEPERLGAALITRDLLPLLGARAWHGRLFTEEEHQAGGPRVVVLSAPLWVRRWGGDPSVIGSTISLNGEPAQVIGVLNPDFVQPEALLWAASAEVFMPLDLKRTDAQNRNMHVLSVIGRLRPAVTEAQVRAELDALATRLAEEHGDSWTTREGESRPINMETFQASTVGDIGRALWMFFGAVGLMLLIACANVANLFLARSIEREQEMAVRMALGASRGRIVAQVLVEGVLLALVGGAAGFAIAWAGVHGFRAFNPSGIPRVAELGVDVRILAFTIVLSAATGILFGLAPAWTSSRTGAGAALRERSARATVGRSRARLRSGLVVAELGLALMLLAGAGVLFHGFVRLRSVDVGFDPEHVMTVDLDVASTVEPARKLAFFNELSSRLATTPGVGEIGASWRLPFADRGSCCWRTMFTDATQAGDSVVAPIHPIVGGYFGALGVSLVEGRDFLASDQNIPSLPGPMYEGQDAPPVISAIVNRLVAERIWPGRSAIGRSLILRPRNTELRIVGVVEPILHWRLDREPGPEVYVPFAAVAGWPLGLFDIAIRHDGPAAPVTTAVRTALRVLEPELPIIRVMPLEDRISESIATPRFYAALLSTFAMLALVLAAAGVYGSMMYVVGLRRREMGIRLALGANSGDVVRLVLVRGAALVITGTILGLAGAIAATRVLRSLVFDVSVTDPMTLASAALLLAASGVIACWVPARRAARTDPVAMLRTE
jgi:predicted permease